MRGNCYANSAVYLPPIAAFEINRKHVSYSTCDICRPRMDALPSSTPGMAAAGLGYISRLHINAIPAPMTSPRIPPLPTLLYEPPLWMRLVVGPLMTAIYLCSEVSRIGIGSKAYQRCFTLFARNRVTPVLYAVFLLGIALLAPLIAAQENSLPFPLPRWFPLGAFAATSILFICRKVTFWVKSSHISPFIICNNLIKPGVQELHVLPMKNLVHSNSVAEVAKLIAASRARRLTMKSPLLIGINLEAGFLKRLVSELNSLGASVSVTQHAPEPISKFATAAFWPMRKALARTPKRIQASIRGDTLMAACINLDLRWP